MSILVDCVCDTAGTVAMTKMCNPADGQCVCKTHTTGRRCDQCGDGYYDLQDYNVFGCLGKGQSIAISVMKNWLILRHNSLN